MKPAPTKRLAIALAGVALAAVVLAACSSGTSTATSSTTTTAGPTTGVKAAIASFLGQQGVQPSQYVISKLKVSSVQPTWAYFSVGPAPGDKATFQSFYGFAQQSSGRWTVVASGSAEVGCPPGAAGNAVVPTAVLSAFGLVCPPVTTTTTTTTTVPSTTTTTSTQSALMAAVVAFQTAQGVPQSKYQITGPTVSTVQPTWAEFSAGPTAATMATFQGGYGFLHLVNGAWSVVAFGSAQVGCPPGNAQAAVVPPAVLSGFGLGASCPSTAGS